MKSDTVYKKTFNLVLEHVAILGIRTALGAETHLAEKFNVSRTTIRKVLSELEGRKLVSRRDGETLVRRGVTRKDYFPIADTLAASDRVEKKFMEWMLRRDHKPDQQINGLELAREFNVSQSAIREYLNRFTRYGLVEKRPNSGWIIRGFTREFALELFEVRELFELRSARAFAKQPEQSPSWAALSEIEREHHVLLTHIKSRFHDFSDLDERFHRLVSEASSNRFMEDFHAVISLIFHYHYQWNKVDERERNAVAIREHLDYIEALFSRNAERIEVACRRHLKSARNTLLASLA